MARKLAHILAAPCLALSSTAYALGVGSIDASSALNQPLEAKIPLLSAQPHELDSLVVTLASPLAFQRAGVERPFNLSNLKFELVKGDKPYIRVRTEKAVKEPFLDFLVEMSWGGGRLVREYTLLLDPPTLSPEPGRSATVSAPAASRAQSAPSEQQGAAVARAASSRGGVSQVSGASTGRAGDTVTVRSNDTLWEIANRVRPEAVTVNQAMVAVFRQNPDAFISGDINRLRSGSVLRVPTGSEMQALSPDAATAEFRRQLQVARTARTEATTAAPARTEPRVQVIAPSQSGGESQSAAGLLDGKLEANSENVSKLQRELALTEESNASLKAENEDLKAQVDAMKERVESLERLVNLQAQPAGENGEAMPEQPAVTEPASGETAAETPAVTEPETAAEPTEPVAQPEPVKTTVDVVAPVTPEPEPEYVSFLKDWRNLAMIGGAVLALVYLVLRRRRGGDAEALPEAAVPTQPIAEPQDDAEAVAGGEIAEDEELEEFDLPAAASEMPPESDALSEAEVYLAYGRYDQARDVIAKAIDAGQTRPDLRLKLMEIAALTQDHDDFMTQAEALQVQVGEDDPTWQRALEMGREFAPEQALFGGAGAAEPEAAADEAADLDFGAVEDAPAEEPEFAAEPEQELQAAPEAEQEQQEPAAEDDFALDFAFDTKDEAEPEQDEALSFDLDEQAEEPAAELDAEPELAAEEPAPELEAADDLAFDLDSLGQADAPESEAELETLDFSVDDAADAAPAADEAIDEGSLEALDEVSTKLDLARAYLDMGDSEGARSLLQEVLEEGTDVQRGEAEGLLAKIA